MVVNLSVLHNGLALPIWELLVGIFVLEAGKTHGLGAAGRI
jgi:hypothetical protein